MNPSDNKNSKTSGAKASDKQADTKASHSTRNQSGNTKKMADAKKTHKK